jgi:hypothetical protein
MIVTAVSVLSRVYVCVCERECVRLLIHYFSLQLVSFSVYVSVVRCIDTAHLYIDTACLYMRGSHSHTLTPPAYMRTIFSVFPLP